jgi:hypothetical protein
VEDHRAVAGIDDDLDDEVGAVRPVPIVDLDVEGWVRSRSKSAGLNGANATRRTRTRSSPGAASGVSQARWRVSSPERVGVR